MPGGAAAAILPGMPDRTARIPSMPVRSGPERRGVVLGAALALFAAVFVAGQLTTSPTQSITLLYVVPIALVALELGIVAGLGAAALAFALLLVRMVTIDIDIGALGAVTRATAFVAVGGIAGRFSDRMRATHEQQRRLLASGLELAHLAESRQLSATLAHGARRLLGADGVAAEMSGTPRIVEGTVGGAVETVAVESRGVRHGTLTVAAGRQLDPDERSMLALLALQGAVAAENLQLLDDARERAVIRAELHEARLRLDERGRQLRALVDRHEHEREHVAHELHEEAAQALAGVLLGLSAVERALATDPAAPDLEPVRTDIDATLRSLRSLAASLRPRVLDLGLAVAVEHLAATQGDPEAPPAVSIELPADRPASAAAQTTIYRIIEEAVAQCAPITALDVHDDHDGRIEARLRGRRAATDEGLGILRARLDLIGGALAVQGDELVLSVPLGLRA